MSEVEKVREQVKGIDAELDITDDAAEQLTAIPSMFRGMALKAIAGKAQEEGVKTIDKDLVDRVNKERMGG